MEEKNDKNPERMFQLPPPYDVLHKMRFEFLSGENGVLFQEKRVDEKS